jgi:hypothetical protein
MFDDRSGESDRIRFLPREGSIMEALNRNTSFVRNPSNAIEADHYTPVFAVLNLRDPAVRAYWLRRWRARTMSWDWAEFFSTALSIFPAINSTTCKTRRRTFQRDRRPATSAGGFRPAQEPPAAILS